MSEERNKCEAKIIELVNEFHVKQMMCCLKYINSLGIKICTASDGSRINLSRLSTEQLNKLYEWVQDTWQPIPEEFLITLSDDEDEQD